MTESTVLLKGLMHVYGPPDSGKSTLAWTACTDPKKICYLDGDSSKSKEIAEQLGVGEYHDLTVLGDGLTDLEYHDMILKLVADLPENKFDLIVLDNPSRFYSIGNTYVHVNRPKFKKQFNHMGPIAGAEEWNELRKTHYPAFYSRLLSKAALVIVCTHEKDQSDAGVKTGATIPDADKSLRTQAGLVIRLARDTKTPDSFAPVGLVVKNHTVVKSGKLLRLFPDKISPCEWDRIAEYLDTPMGNRAPTESERPDDFEYHLIEGTLNPEQQRVYEFNQRMALLQVEQGMVDDVIDLYTASSELPDMVIPNKILTDLRDAYPELTIDKIKSIIDEFKEQSKGG